MLGAAFCPFIVLFLGFICGLELVNAVSGNCPWYIFILTAIVTVFCTILCTIGACQRSKCLYQHQASSHPTGNPHP